MCVCVSIGVSLSVGMGNCQRKNTLILAVVDIKMASALRRAAMNLSVLTFNKSGGQCRKEPHSLSEPTRI